jgi:hypothetical protein
VMSLGIGSKSSRYLMPILPSLVHLQLRGLGAMRVWLVQSAESRLGTGPTVRWVALGVTAVGLLLTLWLPITQAAQQLRHFDDPVYRTPFVEHLARTVEEGAPATGSILWRGALHSIYPEDPVFFPHDETFMFYHVGARALEYFLGRDVSKWDQHGDLDAEAFVGVLDDTGVVVTSTGALRMTHRAHELPERRDALFVDFVERRSFALAADGSLELGERARRSPRLELLPASGGYVFRDDPRDRGWSMLLQLEPDAQLVAIAEGPFALPARIELVRSRRQVLRYGD